MLTKLLAAQDKPVKIARMDNSKFAIFEAVKNAYLFVGREWLYLLKAGSLPVVVQVVTALFVQLQREDASATEAYLWGMPATLLFAWFTFLETRLLLLNERLDELPRDPEYLKERQHGMKLAVIINVLFNMAMAAAVALLTAAANSGQWGANLPLTLGGLFLIGAVFWGVRFGVLPILAAVHYPFRPFLQQVKGPMFPLRLITMGAVCLFPVAFLFQMLLASIMSRSADMAAPAKLTQGEQLALVLASAPLSLLIAALLTAASTYALKQLLDGRRDGVIV